MRRKKNKEKGRRPVLSNENTEEKDLDTEVTTEDTKEEETENTEENIAEETADNGEGEIEKLKAEIADSNDKYLRLMAEYDNFRKRSAKERLEISDTVKGNTVKEILPLFDNFERALETETTDTVYKQGVEMIFKQFGDMLTKLGIEIIDPQGETFDPNIANAVNQIEAPELGENVVAQVFQKGYKIGGKVIRYAMVVVANP